MGSDARVISPSRWAGLGLATCLLVQACGDGDAWLGDSGWPHADAARVDAAGEPLDADSTDAADAAGAPADAGEPNDARPSQDSGPRLSVVHYEYNFDLAEAGAEATLSLAAQGASEGCTRLSSKLPLSELSAVSASPFSVAQQGSELSVCGSSRAGQAVTLSARTVVPTISDPSTGIGLSRKLDRAGSPFAYLLGWVEACDLFGPCDPTPSALANYTINVSHAPDDVVLCPGLREVSATHTRCTLLGTRAPSYSAFSISANPGWLSTPLISAAGVDVLMFEGAQGSLRSQLDAAAVGDFLRFLSELLGPFPYGNELRVAGAPVPWLGMEHPANIVLREDLADVVNLYQDVPLHTLLHEIAHQWAGNRVTLASALDYAWKEAVAEYLVYTFEQRQRPAAEAQATLKVWHSTGTGAPYPVRPLAAPTVPLWVWTAGAYGSGPMTLFIQLEPYLGQDALLGAVQEFLAEPGARSIEDWQHLLEARSGVSLQTYFNAWVYGRDEIEWPAFHVESQLVGAETQLKVTQTHATRKRFPCVVELELRGEPNVKQRVEVDFGLDPLSTTRTGRVSFAVPVTSVRIDPDGRLLDWSLSTGQKSRPTPVSAVRFHP